MYEKCFICHKSSSRETLAKVGRGLENLKRASIQHNDDKISYLRSTSLVSVHESCRKKYIRSVSNNPQEQQTVQTPIGPCRSEQNRRDQRAFLVTMERICSYIENSSDCQFTLTELREEAGNDGLEYDDTILNELKEYYGNNVTITVKPNKSMTIICFSDSSRKLVSTLQRQCRLCGSRSKDMYEIFGKNSQSQELQGFVQANIPIVVYETDPLSKRICINCLKKLRMVNDFMELTRKTQEKCVKDLEACQDKNADIEAFLNKIKDKANEEMSTNSPNHSCTRNKTSDENEDEDSDQSSVCRNRKVLGKKTVKFQRADLDEGEDSTTTDSTASLSSINGKYTSDSESEILSDDDAKRRRIQSESEEDLEEETPPSTPETSNEFAEFHDHEVIDMDIVNNPDYLCNCEVCGKIFKNLKLLAVHETVHMGVHITKEVFDVQGEVDQTPDEQLNDADDNGERISDVSTDSNRTDESSLLIERSEKTVNIPENQVVIIDNIPMINGVVLENYDKEIRKDFYQMVHVAKIKKVFCPLCRYCFKTILSFENHYFGSLCQYSCKYCGARYPKEGEAFKEHVGEHLSKKDQLSNDFYVANRENPLMPKILDPSIIRFTATKKKHPSKIRLAIRQATQSPQADEELTRQRRHNRTKSVSEKR